MKSADIRQAFLDYFQSHGHEVVPSSSLVPADDPTLLFTNAGMNQFKDLFLGKEKRSYVRATTTQKCVRAGGKHNDLENVGYTARHHTFFEMLGNFSFGDYFKYDAVRYAWEFLTSPRWLNIPRERLWVTVYEADQETYELWRDQIGVPEQRIVRIGDNKGAPYASDNFWQMGDTGPCGPCTEVFYDHGEGIFGGPPGSPDQDGDRYIEIWNVVFMQFNRTADGQLHPLPKPSVDTGMGLERVSAVMQGVHSNYEIDLFDNLLQAASTLFGGVAREESSLRVIADHIRSCAFLIADGVMPSNEGRGFVLRRIIRRAVRHGSKLGATQPFFHRLVAPLGELMGDAFPELLRARPQIEKILLQEEEQFARTLDKGLRLLEQDIAALDGKVIPGLTVFTLYDTYGFPVDLTNDIARERGLTLDLAGYEDAMAAQRERARAGSRFGVDYTAAGQDGLCTVFEGYAHLRGQHPVVRLLHGGQPVEQLLSGQEGAVLLESTPFYAESGGQAGDTGTLEAAGLRFVVTDTRKDGQAILHLGRVEQGELRVGQTVDARVDEARRRATALNHSATHLLHAALRKVLGPHVVQKGSLVDADKLRFDFAHYEAVDAERLASIERLVNAQIRANTPVRTRIMNMADARAAGAMALFGEKYGEEVRVLSMGEGDFSVELCGGTHTESTGTIGMLVITSESGISAGVRRIEAVTGENAERWVARSQAILDDLGGLLKAGRDAVGDKVRALLERNRQLEKEIDVLKGRLASAAGGDLLAGATEVNGIKVLAARLDGVERKALLEMVDQMKNRLGKAVVLLAVVEEGKVAVVAGVTKAESSRFKAGSLVAEVAALLGGKGGGRPDMAQGGGSNVDALDDALALVPEWVRRQA